jgi:hypothetical protein
VQAVGTAWTGIARNALALGFSVPTIGVWLLTASVLPLFVWLLLLGRMLLQLGRGVSSEPSPLEEGGPLTLGKPSGLEGCSEDGIKGVLSPP